MTEADFLNAVVDLARLYGLRVHHSRPARTARGWATAIQGDAGFVDLIVVGRRMIARELKMERGKPTAAQEQWLAALRHAGVDADVWRPQDWRDGSIMRQLQGLRTKAAVG